jgi:hypothetical protein
MSRLWDMGTRLAIAIESSRMFVILSAAKNPRIAFAVACSLTRYTLSEFALERFSYRYSCAFVIRKQRHRRGT